MIHSPRIFKLGLGLILAAGLVSMPVLTGASEKDPKSMGDAAKAKVTTTTDSSDSTDSSELGGTEKASSANKQTAVAKKMPTAKTQAKPKAPAKEKQPATSRSRSKSNAASNAAGTSPKESARARIVKLEGEAKKIAATLTATQKKKLIALLNDAQSEALTHINGVGKSRSAAIAEARPIKSIEDLSKVKGVGTKTLAAVIDHGRGLTTSRSKAATTKSKAPTSSGAPKKSKRSSSSTGMKKKA